MALHESTNGLPAVHFYPGNFFRHLSAHTFEQRIAAQLHKQLKEFIMGAEGATVDAGLVLDANLTLNQTPVDRLEQVTKAQHRMVPLEFKTFIVMRDGTRHQYRFMIERTAKQLSSKAVLIIQPIGLPDQVAVIPPGVLSDTRNLEIGRTVEALVCAHGELYPHDLVPFLMPTSCLKEALLSLRDVYEGETTA